MNLLENNDSIFDRVLGKVHEKNKINVILLEKNRKNEENKIKNIAEIKRINETAAEDQIDSFRIIDNSPILPNEEKFVNYALNEKKNMFEEITYDIQKFNQIVNPKIINSNEITLKRNTEDNVNGSKIFFFK